MTGPRDNGPFNPPPWPQIFMAAMGLLLMFVSGYIAYHYEWIGNVYVKGPCVFLTVIGFMFPIGFIGNGIDEARARNEWDDKEE
jgi:hypothetical protein